MNQIFYAWRTHTHLHARHPNRILNRIKSRQREKVNAHFDVFTVCVSAYERKLSLTTYFLYVRDYMKSFLNFNFELLA